MGKPLRVLITAGPTREYLDSVRFLSNPSTGLMGYAIARAAARRGHRVRLVSGPVALPVPPNVQMVSVVSAEEMLHASRSAFRLCDAAVFCAAVCDYRPARRNRLKLPKRRGAWSLPLRPTPDIAATLGRVKGRRITIGFAMEDHAGRANAERKLIRKHFDAIILNSVSTAGAANAALEVLTNRMRHRHAPRFRPDLQNETAATHAKWSRWPRSSKAVAARRIAQLLELLATG